MKNSEFLRAVAAHIVEHGWCQGTSRTREGAICLLAAAGSVLGDEDVTSPHQFLQELRQDLRNGGTYLWLHEWNDAPGRTKEEVLSALERTAARLEAEGR